MTVSYDIMFTDSLFLRSSYKYLCFIFEVFESSKFQRMDNYRFINLSTNEFLNKDLDGCGLTYQKI